MTKLTAAQARGLAYYAALDLPPVERQELNRRLKLSPPDPRVRAKLFELNLIHIVGYNYGPLFRVRSVPVDA
jgi:hypothetical protein